MITCINGNYGNLTPEEAAELTEAIKPKIVIPMHYGLFPGNTRDPKEFEKALSEKGLAKQLRQLEVMNPFVYTK
jgi:L-ascorbate metabolism protein UlaG (beta-lactamase superfamily)